MTHNNNHLIYHAYRGGVPPGNYPDIEFEDETADTELNPSRELPVLLSPTVACAPRIPSPWMLYRGLEPRPVSSARYQTGQSSESNRGPCPHSNHVLPVVLYRTG